jgi:hypothetical protein
VAVITRPVVISRALSPGVIKFRAVPALACSRTCPLRKMDTIVPKLTYSMHPGFGCLPRGNILAL